MLRLDQEMDIIGKTDDSLIAFFRRVSLPAARLALFVVFFWFGFLKLLDMSPANPLVAELLGRTLPFITFEQFILFLGTYEMIIGLAFLVPGLQRIAVALLVPHMITTAGPLVLLPTITWQGFLTPTLEGQYIIKNLVIIALAMGIAAHLHPWRERNR
ncbi:MAG: hypothetical protein AAB867_00355 [Patescibacteria group bacterium]